MYDKTTRRGGETLEIKELLADYKTDMKRLRALKSKLLDLAEVDKISSTASTWDSLRNGQGFSDSKADKYLIAKEEIETEIAAIKKRYERLELAIQELGRYYGQTSQLLINCLYRDGMSAQKTKERMYIYDSNVMRKLKADTLTYLGIIYEDRCLGMF